MVKTSLFETFCTSFYGSVLWPMNHNSLNRLYVLWRKIIRRIWSLPLRTHCNLLPDISQLVPIRTQLLVRYCKFYWNALRSTNSLVSSLAKRCSYSDSPVAVSRRELLRVINGNTDVLLFTNLHALKQKILLSSVPSDETRGLANVVRELCIMREDNSPQSMFTPHEIDALIDNVCCQ